MAEFIAFAKHIPHNMDNILGMGVIFRKDKRFGNGLPTWKEIGEKFILEGLDDCADLIYSNNIAI